MPADDAAKTRRHAARLRALGKCVHRQPPAIPADLGPRPGCWLTDRRRKDLYAHVDPCSVGGGKVFGDSRPTSGQIIGCVSGWTRREVAML